jgi:hypothetical protein
MKNLSRKEDSKDPLHSISEQQWTELWHKLRLHAWKRYRWLHDVTGEDLDEIAHQAIMDTITGTRRWPPPDDGSGESKDVPLFPFLCGVVRSIVSHNWERAKNKISLDNLPSNFNAEVLGELRQTTASSRIENVTDYKQLTDKMLELVSFDKEVFRIVELLRTYPDMRPREIAEELGFTMPQMRAAQKRLRRLLDQFRKDG